MVNKTWRLASVSGLVFGLALSGMAHAQLIDEEDKDDPTQKPTNSTVWDAKQLQRLDRNVRKLERSVARIEAKNGPPVLIEPDPEVIALQASVARLSQKIDDQAQSLTRLTGALEDANHKLALAEAQQVRLDTATHRLELLEAHMKDVDQALAPPRLGSGGHGGFGRCPAIDKPPHRSLHSPWGIYTSLCGFRDL